MKNVKLTQLAQKQLSLKDIITLEINNFCIATTGLYLVFIDYDNEKLLIFIIYHLIYCKNKEMKIHNDDNVKTILLKVTTA